MRAPVVLPLRTAAFAAAVSAFCFLVTSQGLFLLWPVVFGAIIVALVAAAFDTDWRLTGAAALVGVLASCLLTPPYFADATSSGTVLGTALGAGALAAFAAAVFARVLPVRIRRDVLPAVAVVLLVGNLWGSSLWLNANFDRGLMPRTEVFLESPGSVENFRDAAGDSALYLDLIYRLRDGEAYYPAFSECYARAYSGDGPTSAFSIRQPLLYRAMALLPSPALIPIAFLLLATGMLVAVFVWLRAVSAPALATSSVAVLCSYYLFFASSSWVLWTDAWASLFALGAVALWGLYLAGPHRGRFAWAAAAVALCAVLMREQMLVLFAAGLVTAWWSGRRSVAMTPWLAGLALFGAVYAVHWAQASAVLSAPSGGSLWFNGGPVHVYNLFRFAAVHVTSSPPLIAVIALLGGAAVLRFTDAMRWYLGISIGVQLVVYLFVGSLLSQQQGVWGPLVAPMVFALAPRAFEWLAPAEPGTSAVRVSGRSAARLKHSGKGARSRG